MSRIFRHGFLGSLATLIVLLSGCREEGAGSKFPQNSASKPATVRDLHGDAEGIQNPIAVPVRESPGLQKGDWASCLRMNVKIQSPAGNKFAGSLEIENACSFNVALLVSPIKTYYRLGASDFFIDGFIEEPVCSILYVFDARVGVGPDAFLGDGSLEVWGWPKYSVLPAQSKKVLPFLDREGILSRLPNGDYGVMISTLVAPAAHLKGGSNTIDLSQGVELFNQKNRSGEVGVRRGVSRISSPVSFFKKY